MAMFTNIFILVRRFALLYLAMFVLGHQWLQVTVFMSLNLVSVVWFVASKPFKSEQTNRLNTLNEIASLVCTYLIM